MFHKRCDFCYNRCNNIVAISWYKPNKCKIMTNMCYDCDYYFYYSDKNQSIVSKSVEDVFDVISVIITENKIKEKYIWFKDYFIAECLTLKCNKKQLQS